MPIVLVHRPEHKIPRAIGASVVESGRRLVGLHLGKRREANAARRSGVEVCVEEPVLEAEE
jgi:hypothetical protein